MEGGIGTIENYSEHMRSLLIVNLHLVHGN